MEHSSPRLLTAFRTTCRDCRGVFAAPCHCDFAYGSFIFYGEKGTVWAELEAINHPVWDFVTTIIERDLDRDHEDFADRLQSTMARIADPVKGQRLFNHHVCPICHSRNWATWGGDRVSEVEVPLVSYERFNRLTEAEKVRLIRGPPL